VISLAWNYDWADEPPQKRRLTIEEIKKLYFQSVGIITLAF
jgi:hypothetical protein